MRDITDEMLRYRECVRVVWNTYFRELVDGWYEFIPVQRELFQALVLAQVFATHGVRRPQHNVWAVPKDATKGINAQWAMARDNRREWRDVQWHSPSRLKFDDFFDWSDDGDASYRDFALVRCEIVEADDPQLAEGQLLVDIRLVQFEFEESFS